MEQTLTLYLLLNLISGWVSACGKDRSSQANDSVYTSLSRAIVVVSFDNGTTWRALDEGLPANTQATFIEKKGSELVLATDNQGIFMTHNKAKWVNIGRGLPALKVNALNVADNTIYAGLYRQGIFRSTNNGISWQAMNEGLPNLNVQAILCLNNSLIAGTDIGIFKARKGTGKWSPVVANRQILSLNEYKGNLIAGTSAGVLLSADEGETWKEVHNKGAIHYTVFIENEIYALYMSGEVYMSPDLGKNWTKFNYYPNQQAYIYDLTKIGGVLLMSNSYGLFRSGDKGQSWENYYKQESFVFFDFLVVDHLVYGVTRLASEFRNRN